MTSIQLFLFCHLYRTMMGGLGRWAQCALFSVGNLVDGRRLNTCNYLNNQESFKDRDDHVIHPGLHNIALPGGSLVQ